jgi:hypothetical protein
VSGICACGQLAHVAERHRQRAGQIQASGALVDFAERTEGGRALAIIDLEDDISKYQIPVGAAGQVAIYTEHWHHVSLLRKILLRMRSWENTSSSKDTDVPSLESSPRRFSPVDNCGAPG